MNLLLHPEHHEDTRRPGSDNPTPRCFAQVGCTTVPCAILPKRGLTVLDRRRSRWPCVDGLTGVKTPVAVAIASTNSRKVLISVPMPLVGWKSLSARPAGPQVRRAGMTGLGRRAS